MCRAGIEPTGHSRMRGVLARYAPVPSLTIRFQLFSPAPMRHPAVSTNRGSDWFLHHATYTILRPCQVPRSTFFILRGSYRAKAGPPKNPPWPARVATTTAVVKIVSTPRTAKRLHGSWSIRRFGVESRSRSAVCHFGALLCHFVTPPRAIFAQSLYPPYPLLVCIMVRIGIAYWGW